MTPSLGPSTRDEPPSPSGDFHLRVAITAAILGLYWYLNQGLTLPLVETAGFENFKDLGTTRIGVFHWSLAALTMGFLGVELISFLVPAGRALRRQGIVGRAVLNRYALRLTVILSALSGVDTCNFLRENNSLYGTPLLPGGRLPMILVVLTVVAATLVIYLLGKAISLWGWGNGFCWLLLFLPGIDLVVNLRNYMGQGTLPWESPIQLTSLTLLLMMILLGLFLLRTKPQKVATTNGEPLSIHVPAFPQGIVPVVIPLILLPSLPLSFYPWLALVAAIVCIISLLTFRVFSSSTALTASLAPFGSAVPQEEKLLRQQTWKSLFVLLLVMTILELDVEFAHASLASRFSFALTILLPAFCIDLFSEARFRMGQAKVVSILELDNPHLAAFFEAKLQENGIAAEVRALRYRQLYFFFEPLIKMELLVPQEQASAAAELLNKEKIRFL